MDRSRYCSAENTIIMGMMRICMRLETWNKKFTLKWKSHMSNNKLEYMEAQGTAREGARPD